jgi:anthranilate phosphoribosyltransferase
MIAEVLATLVDGGQAAPARVRDVLRCIMAGQCHDAEIAAFLTALRVRGETPDDLAAAAEVLREHMVPLDTGGRAVLDTCGTGGDGRGTFNISTAAALVVAGCGVPVVKHGNRGVSSSSGSSDVLAALGVYVEAEPTVAARCLAEAGMAFCFAPRFHPAMRHVAEVRRRLRFRTLFNLVGPLANPARAAYQLIGVGRPELLDLMAAALARLGASNAYVVHGAGGLDEVSLAGATAVRHVRGDEVRSMAWSPEDFGLPRSEVSGLEAADPASSAGRIRAILAGEPGPATDVVVANAAAALLAAERVADLRAGVRLARAALTEGLARQVLERLVSVSHQPR